MIIFGMTVSRIAAVREKPGWPVAPQSLRPGTQRNGDHGWWETRPFRGRAPQSGHIW